jgi:hypothetical protein
MSSLGLEGAARPEDSIRLPRAPQLVMVHVEEPPSQSLTEDANDETRLEPATIPQVARDSSIHVSGRVRASRLARLLRTTLAFSLAVIATWGLGLVLFPNAPREAARYDRQLELAATAPLAAPVSEREEHPSHSSSVQSAPPTPPVANAASVVASADASAQSQPRQQRDDQQRQQPQTQQRGLSSEEVNGLINWGEKFLAQGDVATARNVLERAAQARDARAPLMLGATYDPDGLRRMGMVGVRPDLEQAKSWYARAAELGSREASQRLAALAQLGH